ncbi:MAG: phenylacetic acid degradation protein PaaY [Gammaproteobacteria bacterium]|nr:phenylacetic acid degradation protein PaaY [Gammaproteobacteria bacterium]
MTCYSIDGIVPVIHPSAFVHPSATIIGDVIIAAGCYVGPGAVLRGDFGRLILQEGANMQDTCVMHGFPNTDTTVEKNGHVGHGAVLHGCLIRENALVGMNAVVMDGAVVGRSSIVAAMSFVKAGVEIPDRHLVAGTPSRIIRELSDEEIAWKETGTRDYQQLTRRCLASLEEVQALTEEEPDRPRIQVSDSIPLHQKRRES